MVYQYHGNKLGLSLDLIEIPPTHGFVPPRTSEKLSLSVSVSLTALVGETETAPLGLLYLGGNE